MKRDLPPILSVGGLFALAHSDKPDGDSQNHPIILPHHTCMVHGRELILLIALERNLGQTNSLQ